MRLIHTVEIDVEVPDDFDEFEDGCLMNNLEDILLSYEGKVLGFTTTKVEKVD